ncbi:glutathione S-transferase 1-like [Wyeomyia smithii]|uniref:glutathione S-transferase 1-like n=1 Tax=Wyeomyia smithii TaxID=174621 RepID=UPI002467B3B9|nr:glutathione S-transferase 1-like [Wyeomyia smithii]
MPKLYFLRESAPSRAVQMTALAIGVELELAELSVPKDEPRRPDYERISPQYSIPTLKDKDLVLWESRAIQIYLVDQYGQDDSLYPKDPAKRAKVNERMFFDACILYHRFSEYYHEQVFGGLEGDLKKLAALEHAVRMLDLFLEGQPYVTGQELTIVDLSMLATIATMNALGFDLKRYQNVNEWYKHMNNVAPGAEINEEGAKAFGTFS